MKTNENKEIINNLKWKIEEDGLDYALRYYYNWQEIDDEDFHFLRNEYVKISKQLELYIEQLNLTSYND